MAVRSQRYRENINCRRIHGKYWDNENLLSHECIYIIFSFVYIPLYTYIYGNVFLLFFYLSFIKVYSKSFYKTISLFKHYSLFNSLHFCKYPITLKQTQPYAYHIHTQLKVDIYLQEEISQVLTTVFKFV